MRRTCVRLSTILCSEMTLAYPNIWKGKFRRKYHDNNVSALQRTFPFIPYGSSPSKSGTGTPQVKSRVTGLGRNPLFSLASMISPSVLITELVDHFPAAYERLIHSCVQSCSLSRLTYICADIFVATLWALFTRQRGLISSMASNVLVHTSH